MEICESNKCTGCAACVNACMNNCISLKEDEYCELHPVIDASSCVQCKRCVNVCPNNIKIEFYYPEKCFAAWITDITKRSICASGGIGTSIAEFVVLKKKGVVFGTAYDKEFTPVATCADSLEMIENFKGSKYTQSIVGKNTFRQILAFLREGRFVLYIATPCQIAGLLSFLGKTYDNLLCVDLICHGVSPTAYFKQEVEYLCKKYKITTLKDIRFRGNDYGNRNKALEKLIGKDSNDFALTLWDATGRCYHAVWNRDYYYYGFLDGVSLRENCYSCQYARPERVSDITIGDFIGLDWHFQNSHKQDKMSSVTVNTARGCMFWDDLMREYPGLQAYERDYAERLAYRPSLMEPFHRHQDTPVFRQAVREYGYLDGSRRVLKRTIRKNRFKSHIGIMLNIFAKIRRKIMLS